MTQYDNIGKLLQRPEGATSMDIIGGGRSVSPHSRLAELKRKGWLIWRKPVEGQRFGRYFGSPPDGDYFDACGRMDSALPVSDSTDSPRTAAS